jgi:hypothetical protein
MLKEYCTFMEVACSPGGVFRWWHQCLSNTGWPFLALWVDLNGVKGITNFIHMIRAGHLTYYPPRYRYLYWYLQQGWKALNQKIKLIFFFHTQRGGNVKVKEGEEKPTCNYLKPIAWFLLRDIMWRTDASYFSRKYGKWSHLLERSQHQSNVIAGISSHPLVCSVVLFRLNHLNIQRSPTF